MAKGRRTNQLLLIADGRSIGFARFAGAGVVPEPAEPADPPRTDDPLDFK